MKIFLHFSGIIALLSSSISSFAQCPANFTWTQSNPNEVVFTNTSTPQNPASTFYVWDYGDTLGENGPSLQTHIYYLPGTYYPCLTMYDTSTQFFCTYCDTITVTGTVICDVHAYIAYSSASCATCPNGSAYMDHQYGATAPWTYQWSTGATTSQITGLLPGVYSCCLTDANGCMVCDTILLGAWDSTDCIINYVPNYISYQSGWVYFAASTMFTNPSATTINWDFGDQSQGTGTNPWHQYMQQGMYTVCVTITDAWTQCTATYCDSIFVNIPSLPCFADFYAEHDPIVANQTWIYNLSTSTSSMTYTWDWGDNSPTSTGQFPTHVYSNSGSYWISLVIYDPVTQCSDTSDQMLQAFRLSQPTTQTPHYVNVIPPVPLGISESEMGLHWNLFPNPASTILTVEGVFSTNDKYLISDLAGRIVASGSMVSNSINVTDLASGVFVFTIITENSGVESQRFIRE